MSLADELYNRPTSRSQNQPTQPGLMLAKVVSIKDPDKLGRVQCQGLTEDAKNQMDWCYCMSPFAGKEHGIQFMPDVDDLVVIGYIGGDRYSPLVLGCIWNKTVTMPYPIADGKNFSFSIKTPAKAEIAFEGEAGKEKITIKTPAETVIVMDDEKQLVNIKDKNGKNSIKMDLKGGELEILADKKITLKTGSASLEMESSGKATLKAGTSVTLDASTVEGKGKSAFKASATQIDIKANGQLNLQSSGITNVKGSMLNLN